MHLRFVFLALLSLLGMNCGGPPAAESERPTRPNIVLVMADDMGWGQTGYYNHPLLKTPNLDAMAANGLRLDRFYAGAPVCSPTRATVMTGRQHDRTGVKDHGYALRRQEQTIARVLREAGYATGHFGKWHLNGLRGPGVPILAGDIYSPGEFGFETWLSVTNFFDMNPLMSRQGNFEEFAGDSSEIIVAEALQYIQAMHEAGKPSFTVIWYGSPHDPFLASEDDREGFSDIDASSEHHYGELVAMDRSIGTLRSGLRELGIAEDTLVWFNSDNGGLPGIKLGSVGGLRGFKGALYEGGIRVPAIIEWPAGIVQPRSTSYPAATMDIFPTLVELLGLPGESLTMPTDGSSIAGLFEGELGRRAKPIPFRFRGSLALIDNEYKLLALQPDPEDFQLYNLKTDAKETHDLYASEADVAARLKTQLEAWNQSVEASVLGGDYPTNSVAPDPEPRIWMTHEAYEPYLEEWRERPEYASRIARGR